MSLQGLAAAAVAVQIKETEIEKPTFPLRTSSMPLFKRDTNDLLGLSPSNNSINNNNSKNNNQNNNNNNNSVVNGPSPVSGTVQNLIQPKTDWRLFLTIEERQLIRRKISAAYESKLKTYEELLQTCAAIDEELVYISAPSRLDYFKAGLQFEKRVSEKRKQLVDSLVPTIQVTTNNNTSQSSEQSDQNDDDCSSSSGRSTPDDSEHISKKVKFDPEANDTLQSSL